ncbi:patatin-like phospholipase family protein [Oceanobacter sp. 4_MG-2023]|uniref:patatin-like phospholipase family protein n=1 Tax=Oceanobacter sp. 4_MG-2023 TaxID=3062623 RepID=UPI002733EBC0|nr:patatin-like phospholipase family protein [Oceanobacter sp. 4_MG-2023]MDP2547000.1 patatin-like phospholipase family protein [Oceanobacter sp. 4_MG-2023]
MSHLPLKVFAGAEALQHIREHGLHADDIEVVLGASGGPKWLVLAAMDRYLLREWFAQRSQPLHLLGTSAGAWRLSCFAQQDALAAHQRFLEAYVSQRYSAKPTPQEVATECRHILDLTLGEQGLAEILAHPFMRYHTLVTRCRGLTASDIHWLQTAGWLGAIGANLLSRKGMRPWVDRVLFHHPDKPPIDHFPHLPAQHVTLTADNLRPAILATGAIPLVIDGVRDIAGAPKGTYRDGGITDYQFDLPVLPNKGFVLYPHYFAQAPKGGWFDKKLRWRTASREYYRRTIIIAPSWEFAATLPGGRIPDLDDFYDFDYSQRRLRWEQVLAACEGLADALDHIHSQQRWAEIAEPLPW